MQKMLHCHDPMAAVVYVTSNPGDPETELTKLAVGLSGGMVVSPDWLASNGARGLAAMVSPAINVKRKLWVSSRLRKENPAIALAVEQIIASPDSKWSACTRIAFVNSAIKQPPPLSVLALVTRAEKEDLDIRSAMDLNCLLTFIFKLDQKRTWLGPA